MTVDFARDLNPSSMAFIAAGEQLGLPVSEDLNGAQWTGFGIAQSNIRDGQQVSDRRGVVLAAGALRTPQLLMLSGVGPAGHLSEHGIPVLADLPGVGANLHDHPMITPVWPISVFGQPAEPVGVDELVRYGRRHRPLGQQRAQRLALVDRERRDVDQADAACPNAAVQEGDRRIPCTAWLLPCMISAIGYEMG